MSSDVEPRCEAVKVKAEGLVLNLHALTALTGSHGTNVCMRARQDELTPPAAEPV
jgi:hypothetical protein